MNDHNQPVQPQPWGQSVILPWMPQGFPGPHDSGRQLLGNEVPARVRFALDFLNALTAKTALRIAVTGLLEGTGHIESFDGQKLTHAEVNAQAAACNMLSEFFTAKLDENEWERQFAETSIKEDVREGGYTITCPVCQGGRGSACLLCRGAGKLRTFPDRGE